MSLIDRDLSILIENIDKTRDFLESIALQIDEKSKQLQAKDDVMAEQAKLIAELQANQGAGELTGLKSITMTSKEPKILRVRLLKAFGKWTQQSKSEQMTWCNISNPYCLKSAQKTCQSMIKV